MTINDYIGKPYCRLNVNGFDCWGLISSVYSEMLGTKITDYKLTTGSIREKMTEFTAALANGSHGFTQIDKGEIKNFDLLLFEGKKLHHVGLWLDGKVLHASEKMGGVSIQPLDMILQEFKGYSVWRK